MQMQVIRFTCIFFSQFKFRFNRNLKCIVWVRTLLIDRDEESFKNVTFYSSLPPLHYLFLYRVVNWIFAVPDESQCENYVGSYVLYVLCLYFMSKVGIFLRAHECSLFSLHLSFSRCASYRMLYYPIRLSQDIYAESTQHLIMQIT